MLFHLGFSQHKTYVLLLRVQLLRRHSSAAAITAESPTATGPVAHLQLTLLKLGYLQTKLISCYNDA